MLVCSAQFHNILAVIGERFLIGVIYSLVCSAQFHDILAVIGERFLMYICNLFPITDVPFSC
jgi:hypothetical protein